MASLPRCGKGEFSANDEDQDEDEVDAERKNTEVKDRGLDKTITW